MPATLDDIELAVEFASSGLSDYEAYINLDSGNIYYVGDAVEEPVPDDLYDSDRYILFPSKRDLDLGKRLALSFVAKSLPNKLDTAYEIFSRRGAYAKFKALLESSGQIENWYAYEQSELRKAIIIWCEENDVKFNNGI
jgi:hypothetical protein